MKVDKKMIKALIIIFSVLFFLLGGLLTFIFFCMSLGEPGHGGQMELGLYLMCVSAVGFVLGSAWPSKKK